MDFNKKIFVDNQTVIDAATLNAIQDELIRVGGLLGKDIQSASINDSGHLILTLTDGTTLDAGVAKGAQGAKGDTGANGPAGPQGPAGAPGKDGAAGADGVTPHIGDNGNWYIGSTDTGKPSRGEKGAKGADGKSAYQYAQEGGYTGTETEFAEKLASGALIVTITDNNGTLSADKTYLEIRDAIRAGRPAFVSSDGIELPFFMGDNALLLGEGSLFFGKVTCTPGDTETSVDAMTLEITPNDEVNFYYDIVEALPNPNAITFTGAVTGSYDGSAAMTVNIPSAVTDDHINSLIDTKLGVIENGSY